MSQADLAKVLHQEELLVFKSFTQDDAFTLGTAIRNRAHNLGWPVVIDIRHGDDIWYMHSMPGTNSENFDWTRRKRNLVTKTHNSSYACSLRGSTGLVDVAAEGWMTEDYAAAGGCFPVRIHGEGLVGTVTVSGVPQRDDHKLVSESIAQFLGVDLGEYNLV
jgi:uncharacterized protein (UPF0303 family)